MHTNLIVPASIALIALIAVIVVIVKKGAKPDEKFKAKRFMTANEIEFLGRLEASAPELRFHAQVAMGSLLDAAVSKKQNPKAYMAARGRFSQKIIDFVAQSRESGEIVAIIELDDRTHSVEKDKRRDAMLEQAGYRIVRWESKQKPDTARIRAELIRASAGSPKVQN